MCFHTVDIHKIMSSGVFADLGPLLDLSSVSRFSSGSDGVDPEQPPRAIAPTIKMASIRNLLNFIAVRRDHHEKI